MKNFGGRSNKENGMFSEDNILRSAKVDRKEKKGRVRYEKEES